MRAGSAQRAPPWRTAWLVALVAAAALGIAGSAPPPPSLLLTPADAALKGMATMGTQEYYATGPVCMVMDAGVEVFCWWTGGVTTPGDKRFALAVPSGFRRTTRFMSVSRGCCGLLLYGFSGGKPAEPAISRPGNCSVPTGALPLPRCHLRPRLQVTVEHDVFAVLDNGAVVILPLGSSGAVVPNIDAPPVAAAPNASVVGVLQFDLPILQVRTAPGTCARAHTDAAAATAHLLSPRSHARSLVPAPLHACGCSSRCTPKRAAPPAAPRRCACCE